jgi:hypothetical protein
MSATLRKLDNEPILIVTHEGFLDLEAAVAATVQVAAALAASDEPLYGIIDLRMATTDMRQMLLILYHQTRGSLGTLSAQRNTVVFVGAHPLIRLFRQLFHRDQFGGQIIPIYSTLDDALAAQRARIREDAAGRGP